MTERTAEFILELGGDILRTSTVPSFLITRGLSIVFEADKIEPSVGD
jgi:hypothetical protein